jgi:hypothetical protein
MANLLIGSPERGDLRWGELAVSVHDSIAAFVVLMVDHVTSRDRTVLTGRAGIETPAPPFIVTGNCEWGETVFEGTEFYGWGDNERIVGAIEWRFRAGP